MSSYRIAALGDRDSVLGFKALGLDVPPMAELAMRLRAGGLSLPDGILTVADMVKELKKALCPSK